MLLNKTEQIILEEFTKSKGSRIYGRAIANKFNLNQKTVSNILNKLEKEDILKFKEEGKNKYYFLNKNKLEIKEIIKLIEINKKINFMGKNPKLRKLIDEIEKISKGILIIFGSYAKNTQKKDSDLDLVIIGNIGDLKEFEDSFGIEINVIKIGKNKFDQNEVFIKELMENHIILKGTGEFVDLIW